MDASQATTGLHGTPAANDAASSGADARDAAALIATGCRLAQRGLFAQAVAPLQRAVELAPDQPSSHAQLGWVCQRRGEFAAAIANYRRALALDPQLALARRGLMTVLVGLDRAEESVSLWRDELRLPGGLEWIDEHIAQALRTRDLAYAGRCADLSARLRWGGRWHTTADVAALPLQSPNPLLSAAKLRHDVEQFRYLMAAGVLGAEFEAICAAYERTWDDLVARGIGGQVAMDAQAEARIGAVYNRLVHVRPTPRLDRALASGWDRTVVERDYIGRPPGVVVIDDFLDPTALAELRAFCLESTVWSANRYAHGRLGAFFRDGFNCPLLLQIAEELRNALPRVIGERYPLRQLWGFKNDYTLPADANTHADFAAVNVNFWITPESANADTASGGMVVYEVDAPMDWDFYTYNGRSDLIHAYLRERNARRVRIAYRANRAVIFNSDLFHATEAVHFHPGYANRRINVTMLYGQREGDVHHRGAAQGAQPQRSDAWRSAAFGRARSRG